MHRARAFAVLLASASLALGLACGDTYDEAAPAADAGPPVVTQKTDAGGLVPPARRCDPRKPFTKVERVPGLPDQAACARLDADESTVTFSYGGESRTATRGPDGIFGPATTVPLQDEKGICLTSSADRTRVFHEDYFAVWQETGSSSRYSGRQGVPNKGTYGIGHPFFDEAHGLLYVDFHLVPNYFQNAALGVARITGGTTSDLRRLDVGFGLEGGEEEQDAGELPSYLFSGAQPSADGLALYFGTTRKPDGQGVADMNIWVSTRASLDAPFADPMLVEGANSPERDLPTWISADGCRLFLESTRDFVGIYGGIATYVATRDP